MRFALSALPESDVFGADESLEQLWKDLATARVIQHV
jgi:hypothetical protein